MIVFVSCRIVLVIFLVILIDITSQLDAVIEIIVDLGRFSRGCLLARLRLATMSSVSRFLAMYSTCFRISSAFRHAFRRSRLLLWDEAT